MLKLGGSDIDNLYLEGEVNSAYLGSTLVFDGVFTSIWRTTTDNESITLPTLTNYKVNWGDGTTTTDTNTHVYVTAGDYEVRIYGDVSDFIFNNTGDKDKIISISNYANSRISATAFYGCSNLSSISGKFDNPFGSLGACFRDCSVFNSDLSGLDVSNVTNLSTMFRGATLFNGDISNWDVSNVNNLGSLFYQASSFNGDISNWDVSKVSSMAAMMFSASSFNGDLSQWNTESLTNCATAFQDVVLFNSDIGGWKMGKVTQAQNMLRNTSFNYPLNLWDTSNIENMTLMFGFTTSFNQDISSWSFVSVTSMNNFMFGKTENDYDAVYLSNLLIKLDQDLVFDNMVNINLGFGTIKYDSSGVAAHDSLVSKGFIVESGGLV